MSALNRPVELWQQSTAKWHESMTMYQQLRSRAWRRSAIALHDSKDRCQQASVEDGHKSTDSWKQSKNEDRQLAAGIFNRSTNRIRQPTDRSKHKNTVEHTIEQKEALGEQYPIPVNSPITNVAQVSKLSRNEQAAENRATAGTLPASQAPVSPLPPTSQPSPVSPVSSPSISSSHSPSDGATKIEPSECLSVDLSVKKRRPDEQVRGLLRFIDRVSSQVREAKRLREAKFAHLGDIEHNWINATIVDAEDSAQELAELLEPCRLDMAKRKGKGKISKDHRKSWKQQNRQRADEKQSRLIRYQCRLDQVLYHLENLQVPSKVSVGDSPAQLDDGSLVLELVATPVAELSNVSLQEPKFSASPPPLSTSKITRKPVPVTAELPGDCVTVSNQPTRAAPNIPKIIVTSSPDDALATMIEGPKTSNEPPEKEVMNELLSWNETRDGIRVLQSESLSRIVSEMDNTREK